MKEALQQIVDLLQPVAALADGTPFEHSEVIQRCVDASEIALEALAQPAQRKTLTQDLDAPLTLNGVALYPQRTWVGLTDEEIDDIYWQHTNHSGNYEVPIWPYERAIEAKLKEKNT